MNTISTLIPRQNCPNNPVHFIKTDHDATNQRLFRIATESPPGSSYLKWATGYITIDLIRIRHSMRGFNRIQQDSTGFNRIQQDSTGFNRIQQDSTGFNRIQQDFR